MLSGILRILLAVILWASIPVTVIWLLGTILGIQLISEGAALGYLLGRAQKLMARAANPPWAQPIR